MGYPKWKIARAFKESMAKKARYTDGTLHEIDLTSQMWEREIAHKEGYKAFASFLSKEFAVENLLYVTEYIQLKDAISDSEAHTLLDDKCPLDFNLHLPSDLQISAMVGRFNAAMKEIDVNNMLALKSVVLETMREFYEKYIEPDQAPLEINIASRKRRLLVTYFKKDDEELMGKLHVIQSIMTLLDSSAEETEKLIHDAAIRYRTERRRTRDSMRIEMSNEALGTPQSLGPVVSASRTPSAGIVV